MATGTMKAAVFEGKGKLTIKDVPEPKLEDTKFRKREGGYLEFGKGDLVKLKVLATGICGTDVGILGIPQGYPTPPGTIIGHEFVAEVVEKGKRVFNLKVGDRVVIDEHISCGLCYFCRTGFPNRCQEIASMGMSATGGFTEYVIAPAKQCYKISQKIPLERAALFEPLSNVYYALNMVRPQPHEKALIFGAGPIGCMFLAVCKLCGLETVIISEPSAYRRKFIRSLDPTKAINPVKENLKKLVEKFAPEGIDISIDACGVPVALKDAIEVAKPHGKVLLFGEQDDLSEVTIKFVPANRKELKFYGSDAMSFMARQTVELLERKDLPLEKLVTHRFPLEQIHEGIDLMREGKAMKIIIYPQEISKKA